jgi:hypothetical protein
MELVYWFIFQNGSKRSYPRKRTYVVAAMSGKRERDGPRAGGIAKNVDIMLDHGELYGPHTCVSEIDESCSLSHIVHRHAHH